MMIMTALELKTLLIHRITEINDISFLKALKTIIDSRTETEIFHLTQEQIDEIIASKKQIAEGLMIDNETLDAEVQQWFKGK